MTSSATPALHTVNIFGDLSSPIRTGKHVVDGYLIDDQPPVWIETALAQAGIKFEAGEEVEILDTPDREGRSRPQPRRDHV